RSLFPNSGQADYRVEVSCRAAQGCRRDAEFSLGPVKIRRMNVVKRHGGGTSPDIRLVYLASMPGRSSTALPFILGELPRHPISPNSEAHPPHSTTTNRYLFG